MILQSVGRWPHRVSVVRARLGQRLLVAVVSIALFSSTGGVGLADGEGGGSERAPGRSNIPAPPPGTSPEAARKAYMTLLFQEINLRRDKAASPRFDYMADAGSEAVDAYLKDLLPAMVAESSCFHGSDHPGMRAGWDYLGDVGIATSEVGGEVLACPDVDAGGFWTPPGIATGWWNSPHHFATLYADNRPRVLACGADVPIKNGLAYETVACLTLMGDK
jgi:hypothetical protein